MSRDDPAMRLARVGCVLGVGRRLAAPEDPLGRVARQRLTRPSGLSSEGIALALEHHLETDSSPADLERLVTDAARAPRCHVVLAANVCIAPLRAITVAVASAPVVVVRPSRRDPVLAQLLVAALERDPLFAEAGGQIALTSTIEPEAGDHVHAYGTDETLDALEASLPRGVRLWRHGTGIGIAIVGRGISAHEAAEAVAIDVVPFDQQGCLSPRFVLVEGEPARAERFAGALHASLRQWDRRVPRGPMSHEALGELSTYRAIARALGPIWEGDGHLVTLDPMPSALWLAPPCRAVPVVPIEGAALEALLGPWARFVTIVGASGLGEGGARGVAAASHPIRALCPRARHGPLGAMQRPPLDGPVDLRERIV